MGDESKKADDASNTNIYNIDTAELLANEAQLLPLSDSAPIYEKLLATFPTSAKFWKQYVEAYMAANNDVAVKQIFSRCLLNCLHMNLWRSYIQFIRRVNEIKGPQGLEETKKAFDFMLSYVGSDIGSGPVWLEYIAFLKMMPGHDETQTMTAVRKAYQQAILIPTHQLDQLWRDYELFENSVSRPLAKGLLSDYQPKFNSAKAVYRERKKLIDEIDWNILAIPPTGSAKEEAQCIAWKRLLAFEKGNPQRIDAANASRRVNFTYEQCLMYLYHHPDVWYDYAMWHAKNGSADSAIKIFQRALKALPDSKLLKYAFAELEESRGAIQAAKVIYESLVSDEHGTNSVAHIQFIRFLRRTEGVESARRYFLDARNSPSCTYHIFVSYAMMVFCLDKDPKVAQSVFEAGMKRFMNEPGYILEYADFLCRLNDDRNVRALFERALSSLPPEESVEVWKRFVQFEQTYGDLSSMLKVEQRRKEALSRTGEESTSSALESNLYDVVSRYSFKDLLPCSSKDLDHLSRQQWLAKSSNKKPDNPNIQNGLGASASQDLLSSSANPILPDVSRMVVYDPRQAKGQDFPTISSSQNISNSGNGKPKETDEILKYLSPSLLAFMSKLPPTPVEGATADIDIVLSILLQSNIPLAKPANQNGSRVNGKRKNTGQEEEEMSTVQSRALPRDVFRLRQMHKTRGGFGGGVASSSQTGTGSAASGGTGSALSGDHSLSSN